MTKENTSDAIPANKNNGRSFSIEAGKLAAAYGVAVIHLGPTTAEAALITDVGRLFPVYYFFASAIHFTIKRASHPGGRVGSVVTLKRLLAPYFAWTIIYLALRCLKTGGGSVLPQSLPAWAGALFFGQSAVHLYFIPLLLFFQMIAICVARWHAWRQGVLWLLALLGVSVAVGESGEGYFGWAGAFTMGLVYAALGLLSASLEMRAARFRRLVIAVAVLIMLALGMLAFKQMSLGPAHAVLAGPLFGWSAFLLLQRLDITKPPLWLVSGVSCYFGIYLTHHAVEEALEVLCSRLGHPLTPYDVRSRLLVALVTCAAGVVFTLMVRRWPVLAFWLLGEAAPTAKYRERGV